jgi:hypothetical protein
VQVPFAKDSYTSSVPVNWYAAADTDKQVILMGAPGTKVITGLPTAGEVRGLRVGGNFLYAVCGNKALRITSTCNVTVLGTISTFTGKVWIEYNGVQVCFVDGQDAWVYTMATNTFSIITDADFPGAAALTYQDGYGAFINPNTGQFWLTGLYDFTSITATDYASAEGWPDNLVSIMMNYRELWLFGSETIEVWYNAGSTFPFARIQGGLIEQGCIAPASVAKGDNVVYWLAGTRQVMIGKGYQPQIISTRKMEREIEQFDTVSDAIAWFQVFEGHSFYWLTFPTANKTYVYDAATQVWHKRASWPDQDRHRANCYAYFNGKHVVGDYLNGNLYEMSRNYYDDDGYELIAEVESPEIRSEGKRQFFTGLEVQFNRGDLAVTTDPAAILSWSNDSGKTWSNELSAGMGNVGEYTARSIWRRLGSGYNRIFKLKVSDPVSRDILSVNWLP